MRPCTRCLGAKQITDKGFTATDGTVYADKTRNCYCCNGAGEFPPPDYVALEAAIKGRKGLRSARPKDERTIFSSRTYYVWRNARFHGGIDVTMPIMAALDAHGDPYLPELDAFVDQMAQKHCGTTLAAAHRWAGLLSNPLPRELPGLPPTAYQGGPVCLGEKPEEEQPELF